MEQYFVLDEQGEPKRELDVEAWTEWFERADRGVARTSVSPDVTVLTIFRGVHENPEPEAPLHLFETRVFGGILDGEEVAHSTRAEAIEAHAALAQWCRVGSQPDAGLAILPDSPNEDAAG
jgi:hypothetical protein